MSKQAHIKSILTTTSLVETSVVNKGADGLQSNDFKKALISHGYDVLIERALRCPCSVQSTGQALLSCQNCCGAGWVFINKKRSRALVQHVNQSTKYLNWTEQDRGTIQITTDSADNVTFMDRVTIEDVDVTYSQVVRFHKSSNNSVFCFLFYYPLKIEELYLFESNDKPLKLLNEQDFQVVENRIVLNNWFSTHIQDFFGNFKQDDFFLTGTIRYKHNPTYHIIDVNREISKNRNRDCAEQVNLKSLPIASVARKTHFILDQPDFIGQSVYDNSHEV